jgi:hypothetical protein
MLPESDDHDDSAPSKPVEEAIEWDQITDDEKRFLTAIRERGMPKWMQKRFEKWQAAQEKKAFERRAD